MPTENDPQAYVQLIDALGWGKYHFSLDGRILDADSHAQSIFGLEPQDKGRSVSEIVHLKCFWEKFYEELCRSDGGVTDLLFPIHPPEGERRLTLHQACQWAVSPGETTIHGFVRQMDAAQASRFFALSAGKKVILLVEDNPDDVLLTLRAFKKSKVQNKIVVARDGEEALNYLFCEGPYKERDPAEDPQVVLLDIKLPKIDGLEVLRRLRQQPSTRMLPVVILTTSEEQSDIVQGYELGANSYIRKPVNFSQFVEAVGQLTLYWMVINEPPPRK